jgi:malonyl-CoA O-methyltransferase
LLGRAVAQLPAWAQRLLALPPARLCADATRLPLPGASVDLIFSSLMLQWCEDLDASFAEFRRVLRPGGLLLFSTFGPDTLLELRQAWSSADGYNHVNRFLDVHDVGSALSRQGFAEPVLDVDRIARSCGEVRELMQELKQLGAHNVTEGRARGMTGRRRWQAMQQSYEARRVGGRLPVSYEVIYGCAWMPQAAALPAADRGEFAVDASSIAIRRRRL